MQPATAMKEKTRKQSQGAHRERPPHDRRRPTGSRHRGFLLAPEGHTQEVEVQRGAWTIYCRCRRCEDVHTYEVDNEARERAIGLPPWPELKKKMG